MSSNRALERYKFDANNNNNIVQVGMLEDHSVVGSSNAG